MKIRWTENSLRLRITPSELARLRFGECIETCLGFAGTSINPAESRWRIALVCEENASESRLDAQPPNGAIIVLSPDSLSLLLAPDREGVYFQQSPASCGLRYFVEKDFPCAHPRSEEAIEPETETFLPPSDFEERKSES